MTPARRLRERLATGEVLLIGGAYNALVARIYERAGFEALYTGGYAAAAANFALPDIGLMTQTEMVGHVERISKAVSLPLVSDADTGFGELTNVARTVREYERAGAAAIQLEDKGNGLRPVNGLCPHFGHMAAASLAGWRVSVLRSGHTAHPTERPLGSTAWSLDYLA
jgi:2-methylisocitrate lyase-like PEP mutase family enzyme